MKRICLPETKHPDIGFYLALEEWAAASLPPDRYFFAWQVAPSIICGRHQEIALEVNVETAAENGIQIWRRKSGGGAVLADMNNVMFSFITPLASVETCFDNYTSSICAMLASLGIDAAPTGRNDIAVNGKKVAGNAFFKTPDRCIVHGTMLVDADAELMNRVLTPSRAKLESKRVCSVSSHITTLRANGLCMTCAEFIDYACNWLCEDEATIHLSESDIAEVDKIRESYLDESFLNLNSNLSVIPISNPDYINNLGQISITCYLTDNKITSLSICGDVISSDNIQELTDGIIGCPFNKNVIFECVSRLNPQRYIVNLTPQILTELILKTKL